MLCLCTLLAFLINYNPWFSININIPFQIEKGRVEVCIIICEARTQHQRSRTSVRRGGMWRRARDATARASSRIPPRHATCLFSFLKPTRTDLHRRGSESGQFELNRANSGRSRPKPPKRLIQAEIQKKKKSAKRTVWTKS